MIKLQLPEKPAQLTPEKEQELVDKFKTDGSAVWKKPYIEKALLEMTHNKCAYSEQELNQESAYMEIDHFKYKDKYPDEVVRWGNLLPSCKKCNASKNDWDVMENPIVNPLTDIPRDYLYVKGFRFYKKNDTGENTIIALSLNDRNHFVQPRAEIGFKIVEILEDYLRTLKEEQPVSSKRMTHIVNRVKTTLQDCGPEHGYSAVLATFLLYESPVLAELETCLRQRGAWDQELEDLKTELEGIALPPP